MVKVISSQQARKQIGDTMNNSVKKTRPGNHLDVRPAKKEDISSIAQLAQEVYTQTFGSGMTHEELQEALETRSESYFQSIFTRDTILLAEDRNVLIGFIQFGAVTINNINVREKDIELNKLYIRADQQGKGIGKLLMEAMLNHDRLENVSNIYLDVFTKNDKAIGLYQKYGFKTVGKTPFKVDGKILGYDLIMKKSL